MAGVDLIECTSGAPNYPLRYLSTVFQFLKEKEYDIVFVGFFGQPLMPVIASLTRKPVILDAFISGFDTMCFDRKKCKPYSSAGKALYWLDRKACELADLVICDTNAHIDYFCDRFSIDRSKFARVFVGAEDDIFYPRERKNGKDHFSVLYYGTYLPLHGFEYVIRAAKLLEDHKEIRFKVIGSGMMKDKIRMEAEEMKTRNIEFVDWVPYRDLPGEISEADICLGGHFSGTEKADRVIAGKSFQMAAVQKPLILGDYEANKEFFRHGENAYFTRVADEKALAESIISLKNDKALRGKISRNAYEGFLKECNLLETGNTLRELLERLTLEDGPRWR